MMKIKAFTLIELMIVAAILGIIAAFAIPSYNQSVIRSKRADGMGALLNAINSMERYRAANMSYLGAAAGVTFNSNVPSDGGTPYYNIALGNLTATTYTLTANPVNSMLGQDPALTINQAGQKTWGAKTCWPESGNDC